MNLFGIAIGILKLPFRLFSLLVSLVMLPAKIVSFVFKLIMTTIILGIVALVVGLYFGFFSLTDLIPLLADAATVLS